MNAEPTKTTATPTDPVALTPKAAEKVRASMTKQGAEGSGLRISVVSGGCSGFEYALSFAEAPQPGDLAYESQGVRLFVDPTHLDKLAGTVLDFVDGLHGAGLKFTNPNAAHSCGCGSSFSA